MGMLRPRQRCQGVSIAGGVSERSGIDIAAIAIAIAIAIGVFSGSGSDAADATRFEVGC